MAKLQSDSSYSHSSSTSGMQSLLNTVTSSFRNNAGFKVAGFLVGATTLATVGAYFNADDARASQDIPMKSSSQAHGSGEAQAGSEASIEGESSVNSQSNVSGSSSQGVSSSISSTTDANGQTHTQVIVNGQEVEVPQDGSVSETIDTANGQVHVNVNSNNSNSSTSISTQSHSSTSSHSSQTYTQQGEGN